MWWMPLAMMGAGLAKHYLVDEPAADRQTNIEATKAQYSPWTGLQPRDVAQPNLGNTMLQAGMSGLMMGQQSQQADDASLYQSGLLQAMGGKSIEQLRAERDAYGKGSGNSVAGNPYDFGSVQPEDMMAYNYKPTSNPYDPSGYSMEDLNFNKYTNMGAGI